MEFKKYKLGELCRLSSSKRIFESEYVNNGIPFIRGQEISDKSILDENSKFECYISEERYNEIKEKYGVPQKGDILMTAVGTIGNLVVLNSNRPFYFKDGNVIRFSDFSELIDSTYLALFMKSPYFNKQIQYALIGAVQKALTMVMLSNIEIPLPEISIQKRIATILMEVNSKIETNKKINKELEVMAKELYDYWFVQFDFLNEEGKPYKSSGGKMVYNEVLKREIPDGWEVKKLCNLAKIQKNQIEPEAEVEYKHYSLPSFDECESYSIEKGDNIFSDKFLVGSGNLLISKLNPWTDRTVWVDNVENAICSTEYVVLKQDDKFIQSYLYHIAHTQSFIDYCTSCSTGTSHSHRRVNPDLMVDYKVPFRKEIVETFGKNVYPIIQKKLNIQRENRELVKMRDELLPMLMNGQVSVK